MNVRKLSHHAQKVKKCYDFLMISMISGKIEEIGANHIVVMVGGIGYKVYATTDTLLSSKIGAETKLWTYLAVREDALDLYGFTSKKDKLFFELLISISGIGPKSALNILSIVSSDTLADAIRSGSTTHLVKISGIGKKTAEKIVLELKDKVGSMQGLGTKESAAGMASEIDAIEALRSLGYDADESREALKKVGKDITDVGAKVKAALKHLG